jgi:protein tyrosine phosphatase type 4A
MNDKSPPKIPFNRILSPVESNHLKFLILDCPTDQTLPLYIEEMKTRHVSDVVRVCEPTYNKEVLIHAGINVHDWPFKDGGIPPNDIVMNFLTLCDERFGGLTSSRDELEEKSPVIV